MRWSSEERKARKKEKRQRRLKRTLELVLAGKLHAPESFKTASIYELELVCNGCGAANAKFDFVPDRIYGTYIGEACDIHDWMYDEGLTIEDKDKDDRVFVNNIYRLIKMRDKWYKPTALMRIRAKEYYLLVKYLGGSAFWAGKNPN